MSMLSNRLNKHFVVAAAAVAVVGATQAANADVVYSGVVNISIPVNIDGVYLNMVTGANGSVASSVTGWDINPYSGTTLSWFLPSTPAASHGVVIGLGSSAALADNLAVGTMIDAAQAFGGGSCETAGATAFVFGSASNIVGLRFFNESTSTINYGWMRLELGATFTDPSRKIVEYAYDNSGAGIGAGVVPAPSSLALIGLAGGLTARRRRA